MITLHDEWGGDDGYLYAVAELREGFRKFDYLRIADFEGREWIGQIVTANLNVSVLGRPIDSTVMNGLHLRQRHNEVRSIECIRVFKIALLGEYDGESVQGWDTRPEPGATARPLDAAATRALLGLPAPVTHADGTMSAIGRLPNVAGEPLCVSPAVFQHHALLAGSSGFGKSNTVSNLVAQAQNFGCCVIMHDPKPDYGRIAQANSEADERIGQTWSRFARFGLRPRGARDVLRVGFYDPDPGKREEQEALDVVLGIDVADLEPHALASVFFAPGLSTAEDNAHEAFTAAAGAVLRGRSDNAGRASLQDIVAEVARRGDPNNRSVPIAQRINQHTAENIQIRVQRRRVQLPWLDAVGTTIGAGRRNVFSRPETRRVERFSFEQLMRPGRVIVINHSGLPDEAYALIATSFLDRGQWYRRRAVAGDPPLVQVFDEGHRIFENRSRHSATLEHDFGRVMREGRSRGHWIILSVQNPSQVPAGVRNQISTAIIFRFQSEKEAKEATQGMPREFAADAMNQGKGRAIVKLLDSAYVLKAEMAPSPFELERMDNLPGTASQPPVQDVRLLRVDDLPVRQEVGNGGQS